jgi:hypothetical protein
MADMGSPQDAMRISNVVDRPLYSVLAKLWTAVTDDDNMVSHLISLYFTWEHVFFVRMDRGLFLQDIITGRSTFCSPLLVNAMLAHATVSTFDILSWLLTSCLFAFFYRCGFFDTSSCCLVKGALVLLLIFSRYRISSSLHVILDFTSHMFFAR